MNKVKAGKSYLYAFWSCSQKSINFILSESREINNIYKFNTMRKKGIIFTNS